MQPLLKLKYRKEGTLSPLKVILSAGGTGGHIFPSLAVADAIKHRHPDAEILFVGAQGKMEMERVPKAGYQIEGLWISGIQRKLTLDNLIFPVKLMSSLMKAKIIISKFKPDVVIGFGGFASGPTLRAAASKGIPTVIQEQNSYAGLTNKWLGKTVDKICVAFEGLEKYFPKNKIVLTGNPVRKDILDITPKRGEACKHFKLHTEKKTLLIIGGSLGAKSINEGIMNDMKPLLANDIQILWQTGKNMYVSLKMFEDERVRIFDFIDRMDLAYAAADVIISRAGASSVSELCIVGKPVILVPYPHAAEDHQTKNAMALVNNDAAILIKDSEAGEKLCPTTAELLKDADRQHKMSANIKKLARPNATEDIVNEILKLIHKN